MLSALASIMNGSPHEISQYTSLDQDSQGRYYAFSDYSQVLVYDRLGRFLQTIGRSGSGPGELGSMQAYPGTNVTRSSISQVSVGRGDTIIVFHGLNISLFSPSFEFVRRISVTPVGTSLHSLYRLPDGRWLLGGDFRREPSHAGRSIHIADASGRVTRSIGPDVGLQPGRGTYLFPSSGFKLAPGGETAWFTRGYSLERWRLGDSVPEATIAVREVPWLEGAAAATASTGRAGSIRPSTIMFNGIDSLGQLWLVARTTPTVPAPAPREQSASSFILEVFDPRTARVRTSQTMATLPRLLPRGNLAWWGTLNPDGVLLVTVSRFQFRQP